jgi:hypothetical protein
VRRRVTLKEIAHHTPSGSTRQVLDLPLRRTRSISRPLLRSRKRYGPALPPYYYTTLLVKKQIITQQKTSIYYENVFILIANFLI